MMRQLAQMIVQLLGEHRLQRLSGALVQELAASNQQRVVGDLLRERMLENVLSIGEDRLLVDELGRPQIRKHLLQLRLRLVRHFPDQAKRRLPADHRKGLEQFLLLRRKPVDTRGQYALHRRRQTQLRERASNLHYAIAYQRALVEQRLHHLLDEERIALGALDNQSFECFKFHASTEQRRQHCRAVFAAQGVEPELQVVAPARPIMAVLRTVVDEQQQARASAAVGE